MDVAAADMLSILGGSEAPLIEKKATEKSRSSAAAFTTTNGKFTARTLNATRGGRINTYASVTRMLKNARLGLRNDIYSPHDESVSMLNYEELSTPQITTFTLMGKISQLPQFHEQELLNLLDPTDRVFRIKCNWGEKIHDSWCLVNKIKRRPPLPKVWLRKRQGDGSCFNSQITFWVRYPWNTTPKIPSTEKAMQIKVFRNGSLGIPDARPWTVDAIKEAIVTITDMIASAYKQTNETKLTMLSPVMTNYKCKVVLDDNAYLNLDSIAAMMSDAIEKRRDNVHLDKPLERKISWVKFNADSRARGLLMYFEWPEPCTVKLYMSGKVNVLGGTEVAIIQTLNELSTRVQEWTGVLKGKYK